MKVTSMHVKLVKIYILKVLNLYFHKDTPYEINHPCLPMADLKVESMHVKLIKLLILKCQINALIKTHPNKTIFAIPNCASI